MMFWTTKPIEVRNVSETVTVEGKTFTVIDEKTDEEPKEEEAPAEEPAAEEPDEDEEDAE